MLMNYHKDWLHLASGVMLISLLFEYSRYISAKRQKIC